MKKDFSNQNLNDPADDPDNYKWGIFYFNKKDKRIIVTKQDRIRGFTINCANPYTYLLFLGIVDAIILAKYLS
ncbi:MAG: hypothetical protein M0Q51_06190 [Bacteroidales bacterium]|nr:hypothetical protein [Bacteroidales bacterium]